MMSRISLLAMLACWLALDEKPSVAATVQDVRIEHVTIVSPEWESPLGDADVTIHDGRIASITTGGAPGPLASVPPSSTYATSSPGWMCLATVAPGGTSKRFTMMSMCLPVRSPLLNSILTEVDFVMTFSNVHASYFRHQASIAIHSI
jgi:hypothetical protein